MRATSKSELCCYRITTILTCLLHAEEQNIWLIYPEEGAEIFQPGMAQVLALYGALQPPDPMDFVRQQTSQE